MKHTHFLLFWLCNQVWGCSCLRPMNLCIELWIVSQGLNMWRGLWMLPSSSNMGVSLIRTKIMEYILVSLYFLYCTAYYWGWCILLLLEICKSLHAKLLHLTVLCIAIIGCTLNLFVLSQQWLTVDHTFFTCLKVHSWPMKTQGPHSRFLPKFPLHQTPSAAICLKACQAVEVWT